MPWDGGITEAQAAFLLADAVYGGSTLAAGEGAAVGAGALGAGAAASAADSGLLGAGAYGAGQVTPQAAAALEASLGAGGGAEGAGAGGSQFVSDFDKYKFAAQNGFRNVGKAWGKVPGPVQNAVTAPMMQGLLGGGQQPPRENIRPPMGGGGPQSPIAYPQQPMPQATPYAQTMGGPDDEEMKRRLMMMLYGGRNAS